MCKNCLSCHDPRKLRDDKIDVGLTILGFAPRIERVWEDMGGNPPIGIVSRFTSGSNPFNFQP